MSEYHDTETGEIVSTYYSRSAQLNELFAAHAKAQATFEPAEKAGKSNFGKHATLESVLEATAKGRAENHLALIQMPGNGDNHNIAVTTILGHSSGQWVESRLQMAPAKYDAQGAGSVITYLRRYAALSILGVAPEDDDGNAAVTQPSAPVTRGATRTAAPKAPLTEKPAPANGDARPGWIAKFLALDSYEIDPQKAGGWLAWERHYLQVAECTETFEQYARLENDNKGHVDKFVGAVKREVFDDFLRRRDAITARHFVDKADAAQILQT